MKFDPFSWDEVKSNVENKAEKGTLCLRCSAPSALYVTAQGVESLAGFGSEWTLEVAEAVTYRLEAAKTVRVFVHRPFMETAVEPDGEVFTNIDRMPHESGMMAEVTRARRMLEVEKRAMLNEIRREASIARNSVKAKATLVEPFAAAEPLRDEPSADESEASE